MQIMHDAEEQPGCQRTDDTDDAIHCLGASPSELNGTIAGEDIVEAEERHDSEEGSEIECEEADGRCDDDDEIGVEE